MNSSEGLLCLRFGGLRLTQCAYVIMPGWCRSPSVSKRAGCTDPVLPSVRDSLFAAFYSRN